MHVCYTDTFISQVPSLRRFSAAKVRNHQLIKAETSLHQWIWLADNTPHTDYEVRCCGCRWWWESGAGARLHCWTEANGWPGWKHCWWTISRAEGSWDAVTFEMLWLACCHSVRSLLLTSEHNHTTCARNNNMIVFWEYIYYYYKTQKVLDWHVSVSEWHCKVGQEGSTFPTSVCEG